MKGEFLFGINLSWSEAGMFEQQYILILNVLKKKEKFRYKNN